MRTLRDITKKHFHDMLIVPLDSLCFPRLFAQICLPIFTDVALPPIDESGVVLYTFCGGHWSPSYSAPRQEF